MAASRFVLVNKVCGHTIGYGNTKLPMLAWKNKLVINGHKVEIQERDATEAELTNLVDGERCGTCTIDGNTRTVLR